MTSRKSESPTPSSTSNVDEHIRHFQLVEALRTNDPTVVLNALKRLPISSLSHKPSFATPLHIAVSISSKTVVQMLIDSFCLSSPDQIVPGINWINERNSPNGETPLHLASKLGRIDLIEILFQIPNIDDTVRDTMGKVPVEVAKNEAISIILKGTALYLY